MLGASRTKMITNLVAKLENMGAKQDLTAINIQLELIIFNFLRYKQ
jgi:hypothetical protein